MKRPHICWHLGDNAYITGTTNSLNFPTTGGAYQTSYGGGSANAFVTKLNATGTALIYSTYLGGNGDDQGNGIAVDGSGNAYVTGYTASANFPTTPGAFQASHASDGGSADAFVTQLNATGSALVYSTYLGGNGDDQGNGIAIDASGNAYVTGYTASTNFPNTPGAFQTTYGGGSYDAFVTKLNASGNALVYSTYLGGTGDDYGNGIAVDGSGDAYITGQTSSTNFPTTAGAYQAALAGGGNAFVTKLNVTGTALIYSTYLGGNGGNGDRGEGIAVDSGNTYVTGYTSSTNFPITAGAYQTSFGGIADAFVAKFSFPPVTPNLTWTNPAPISYGTPLGNTQLNASASYVMNGSAVTVPGTFAYTPAAGTVLSAGNNQTLSVTFTPTDTIDYTTATTTVAININDATPNLTWSNPAPISYGTPLSTAQFDASASYLVNGSAVTVPGTFAYSPISGTVLSAGNNQTLSVTFTPTDTIDYTAVTTTVAINVMPLGPSGTITNALPTFSWNNITGVTSYEIWLTDQTTNQTVTPTVTGTTWTPSQALNVGDKYIWWVGAVQGQKTVWDNPLTFTIAPTPISPSGSINSLTPSFSWTPLTNATVNSYTVWITDQTTGTYQTFPGQPGPSFNLPGANALTVGHNYIWWVGAVGANGKITWSNGQSFLVTALNTPSLLTPVGPTPFVTTASMTPTFTWSPVNGANSYDVLVNDVTTGQSQAIRQTTTNTFLTAPSALVLGNAYEWWVKALSVNGDSGPWSSGASFSLVLSVPTPAGPIGSLANAKPTFTWSTVAGADFYDVWVNDTTTGQSQVLRTPLSGSQVVSGTSWIAPSTLNPGDSYMWWVRAMSNSGAASSWSSGVAFTVALLATPTVLAPTGQVQNAGLTFQWNAVANASYYDLWVDDTTTGTSQVLRQNVSALSYATTALKVGHSYRWWVRAYSNNGDSSNWSSTFVVTIVS